MKKIILFSALVCSTILFSQKLSDAFILEKINGIEISKVPAILKLKKSPESEVKLGLTSDYYLKGKFSYHILERKGDDKADKTYLVYTGKDFINIVDGLVKEAYENHKFQNIQTYFEIGEKKTNVSSYEDFLKYYRKYSVLGRDVNINSYFKKDDFFYIIKTIYGVVYVEVSRSLPNYL
ncbi:hypothetical protein JSO62_03470 [Riemerella anatipestifer]|uniref:hypothetical protein n=1 Tax=Riemerella anatipestifer TaxID=34085 RepID=UPI0020969150|nr:hypothetical protein [Riemerella anatipestifer]MCO7354709.1 hypothetical protein [Riemerella anatipestifer]